MFLLLFAFMRMYPNLNSCVYKKNEISTLGFVFLLCKCRYCLHVQWAFTFLDLFLFLHKVTDYLKRNKVQAGLIFPVWFSSKIYPAWNIIPREKRNKFQRFSAITTDIKRIFLTFSKSLKVTKQKIFVWNCIILLKKK